MKYVSGTISLRRSHSRTTTYVVPIFFNPAPSACTRRPHVAVYSSYWQAVLPWSCCTTHYFFLIGEKLTKRPRVNCRRNAAEHRKGADASDW